MITNDNHTVVYTIGTGQKKAKDFFSLLRANKIRRIIDVRLNNVSQLAGFTKKHDLAYFLDELCQCAYEHRPDWAPTKDLLDRYKKKEISWSEYEIEFARIMAGRNIISKVDISSLDKSCLLCSEPKADQCHRKLLVEQIKSAYPAIEVIHL
jgi:uncharacterized protein (DUF488 family)